MKYIEGNITLVDTKRSEKLSLFSGEEIYFLQFSIEV